jgi:hypothetical protein
MKFNNLAIAARHAARDEVANAIEALAPLGSHP